MTTEELRWQLRKYDDDVEVQTFDPETGLFGKPTIKIIEVKEGNVTRPIMRI